jgi:hypothetical protein
MAVGRFDSATIPAALTPGGRRMQSRSGPFAIRDVVVVLAGGRSVGGGGGGGVSVGEGPTQLLNEPCRGLHTNVLGSAGQGNLPTAAKCFNLVGSSLK